MWFIFFVTLSLASVIHGDILFPDDEKSTSLKFATVRPDFAPAHHVQETRNQYTAGGSYSDFVDDVLGMGVTNLCLDIDRTVAYSNINTNSNYLVYSPINIASALALILLGSNGKTFDELSNVLGLTYGLNMGNTSVPVHEAFGNMLNRIENSPTQDTQLIKFASAIFVQTDFPVREQYRRLSMALYKSEVTNLDFRNNPAQAKNTINNWVAEKTLGKIQNLIQMDPPPMTKAVIVSSLYFKSEWDNRFYSELTKRFPFYPNGKDQPTNIRVDLISNGGEYPYFNDSTLNCQIFGLPYKGKTVSFYIVVPHNSNPQKLRDLEDRLTAIELKRLVASTRITRILAAIPKMTLTSTIHLKSVLEKLGVKSLFDPRAANLGLLSPGHHIVDNAPAHNYNTKSANDEEPYVFTRLDAGYAMPDKVNLTKPVRRKRQTKSNMIDGRRYEYSLDHLRHMLNSDSGSNPGLYVDQVLHKVFIEVNEKGTEAGATTSASLSRDGNRIVMKVDVPFFFFIHHEQTKTILFWGSVYLPSPSFVV